MGKGFADRKCGEIASRARISSNLEYVLDRFGVEYCVTHRLCIAFVASLFCPVVLNSRNSLIMPDSF